MVVAGIGNNGCTEISNVLFNKILKVFGLRYMVAKIRIDYVVDMYRHNYLQNEVHKDPSHSLLFHTNCFL